MTKEIYLTPIRRKELQELYNEMPVYTTIIRKRFQSSPSKGAPDSQRFGGTLTSTVCLAQTDSLFIGHLPGVKQSFKGIPCSSNDVGKTAGLSPLAEPCPGDVLLQE